MLQTMSTPGRDEAQIIAKVTRWVRRFRPEWAFQRVTVAGSGLEMCVLRAVTRHGDAWAIRVPWQSVSHNSNDGRVEGRDLLRKEARLTGWLWRCGFPVARPLELILDADLECLVTEFVAGDGTPVDAAALGAIIHRLHAIPVTVPREVPSGIDHTLRRRLEDRMAAVARLSGAAFPMPDSLVLDHVLAPVTRQTSLLHLDLRDANILTRCGAVAALVDWSNSLIAHPALEVARLAEYGWPVEPFLAGYGSNPLQEVSEAVSLLLRLDTAVMLAVVFLEEAPDAARAQKQLDRVAELHGRLLQALTPS